jgi:hypothetical protein
MNLNDLGNKLNKRAKEVDKFARLRMKNIATVVGEEIIENTTVDTGRAVSNWKGTTNGAFSEFNPEAEVVGSKGSTARVNKSIAKKTFSFSAFRITKATQDFFLINNTPYIGKIDSIYNPNFIRASVQSAVLKQATKVKKIFKGR